MKLIAVHIHPTDQIYLPAIGLHRQCMYVTKSECSNTACSVCHHSYTHTAMKFNIIVEPEDSNIGIPTGLINLSWMAENNFSRWLGMNITSRTIIESS